jgi:hypothetical protein
MFKKSRARQHPGRAPGTYGGKVREALRIEWIPDATDGSSTFPLWQAEVLPESACQKKPGHGVGRAAQGRTRYDGTKS